MLEEKICLTTYSVLVKCNNKEQAEFIREAIHNNTELATIIYREELFINEDGSFGYKTTEE